MDTLPINEGVYNPNRVGQVPSRAGNEIGFGSIGNTGFLATDSDREFGEKPNFSEVYTKEARAPIGVV